LKCLATVQVPANGSHKALQLTPARRITFAIAGIDAAFDPIYRILCRQCRHIAAFKSQLVVEIILYAGNPVASHAGRDLPLHALRVVFLAQRPKPRCMACISWQR
jgi:hypothetical protein